MKINFSKILVGTTLLLLACFLAFWLYGEFQREKMALQNESYLEIADQLIGHKGGDLYSILSKLENQPEGNVVSIDWAFPDSIDLHEIKNKDHFINQRISRIEHKMNKEGILESDSFQKITRTTISSDNGEASIAIVVQGSDSLFQKDSFAHELSMNFEQSLQSNFAEDKAIIRKKALLNIIPEFLFAIFLFSLLNLGVYLLQKTNTKEQELLESKNNLISNLTHELKTPITTIGVALEAIQDFNIKSDREKTEQYIDISRGELQRLSSAIDQVMLLSKVGNQTQNYNFQNHKLADLCKSVIHNLQLQLDNKNATIQIHGSEVVAKVDETHFKHMLHNLIDNSLKYGQEGGLINIDLSKKSTKTILKIKDNGPGIDPKYHHKVFERFYRISDGDRHDVKGYGLGLSYVKEIVQAHNGHIEIESTPKRGTTFTITL